MKKKGNVCPLHLAYKSKHSTTLVAKLAFVPAVPKICTTFCHPLTNFAANRNTHVLETQIFALVSVANKFTICNPLHLCDLHSRFARQRAKASWQRQNVSQHTNAICHAPLLPPSSPFFPRRGTGRDGARQTQSFFGCEKKLFGPLAFLPCPCALLMTGGQRYCEAKARPKAVQSKALRWPYKSTICMAVQSFALHEAHHLLTNRRFVLATLRGKKGGMANANRTLCFCLGFGFAKAKLSPPSSKPLAPLGQRAKFCFSKTPMPPFLSPKGLSFALAKPPSGDGKGYCHAPLLPPSGDGARQTQIFELHRGLTKAVRSFRFATQRGLEKGAWGRRGMRYPHARSVLEVVQQVEDVICKKQLIECSMGVIISISGGQDSIFLLFCLSFLQSKLTFTFKMLWCNHFWQSDSFYTTLHLTMCAVNFRKTIITFLPLFVFDSDLLGFFNTHSSPTWVKQVGESATNSKLAKRWVHRRMKIIDHRVENNKDNGSISKHLPKVSTKAATSETLARHWRHLTTERSCTFYTLEKAIYGHTLSDRVETIMFNLVRGAGNTGLQSLLWKRKFSTFFYNWFFLSYQHVLYKTHFSTTLIQYHPRRLQ